MSSKPIAYRASLLDFTENPLHEAPSSYRYHEDGLLLVKDGLIDAIGDYSALIQNAGSDTEVIDYRPYMIMPGFIDTHVHYAQTDIIASHAGQLLDWLNRYTYPMESRYSDAALAADTARFFIRQLLQNGTTSAMVFATSHAVSVDAIFEAAHAQRMRLISGKVLMDRHAPQDILDTPQSSYDDSLRLLQRWHEKDRLLYAITPRFAPTSSEQQLKVAQQLVNEFPDIYLQSHVAENRGEIEWVKELFPWSRSYLDVYDHFGLLGDRSVYAHCIYLDEQDRHSLARSGTAVSFCPSSNLFLGSGLFDLSSASELDLHLGLGTDIGAGTSFSLLQCMRDAYRVGQLTGFNPSPLYYFYLATLGAARALYLDDKLGSFETGREADFIVIDPNTTELMQRRMRQVDSIEELLFLLMMLGDERNIAATHVLGECCYRRGFHATSVAPQSA